MSILRYERPAALPIDKEVTTVAEAGGFLLAILLGALLLVLAGIGAYSSSDFSGWLGVVALVALLVLVGGPLALLWWVVRPMWKRCRRQYSHDALALLLLGAGLSTAWLLLTVGCWLALTCSSCP